MNNPTREAVDGWLRAALGPLLRLSPEDIDGDKSFTRYGLDSMTAVTLAAELEIWLGFRLSPTLAWDYPTLNELAGYVAELAVTPPAPGTVDPASGGFAHFSDAQVDALLRGLINDAPPNDDEIQP